MRRQKADLFDHALMAAIVGFVIGALWVADANAQSYTTFPNLRSGNMDFTATIRANGSACASGTAIVSGGGTVTCTAVVPTSQKGAANGVASLDGSGKVPTSQLPFSGLTYDGSWNATTNSPTLADGTGTSGHFYITSVAGSQNLGSGSITFAVGDWALYNGTVWQKVPSSAAVSSVFGRTGAVAATAGDYTATQVTNTPAGGIAATTAQAAIDELDTEKQAAASTLTSWAALTRASGFDTFTQTPSSANLRGLLTDETGTGLAYFQGGALGTPSSGTLTSATGLPWSTGLTGVPTTAAGYGITGGAKLDAYAGGDTPSAFTLGIVDSVDAASWRAAIGAGTSSATGTVTSVSGSGGSTGLTLTGGPITTTGTLTLGGTLADGSLSSNVALKNAANIFTADQTITKSSAAFAANSTSASPRLELQSSGVRKAFVSGSLATNDFCNGTSAGDLCLGAAAGGIAFTTNDGGSLAGKVSSAGNWVLNAPSSGAALSVSGVSGASRLAVWNGSYNEYQLAGVAYAYIGDRTGVIGSGSGLAIRAEGSLDLATGGASPRVQINNTGNVVINAPSSGTHTISGLGAAGAVTVSLAASGGSDLAVTDGTRTGYLGVSSGGSIYLGSRSNHDVGIYTNNTLRQTMSSAGNVTIAAPSSGVTQTITSVAAGTPLRMTDGTVTGSFDFGGQFQIGTTSAHAASLYTNNVTRASIGSAGNVTINAPSSGSALAVTAKAADTAIFASDGTVSGFVAGFAGGLMSVGTSTAHSLQLVTNGSQKLVITSAGNTILPAPSSGTTLSVAPFAGSTGISVSGDNGSGSGLSLTNTSASDGRSVIDFTATRTSSKNYTLGIDPDGSASKSFSLRDVTRGAIPFSVSTTGNVSIAAPSSSSAFVVNGAADGGGGTTWTSELIGSSSSGHSLGLRVRAGTTSGDSALRVMDASNSNLYLDVAGNGGVQIGAPVGGNPGAGGINVSGALQKNGVNACLSDGTNCPGSGSSGTWTATCTASTNVSSCTPNVGQYMRVGNIVTWSMSSSITCTSASVDTITYFSLPVASALTSTYQVAGVVGTAAGDLAMQSSGAVAADATNDRFDVRYVCGSNAGFPYIYYMSGTYQVL